MCGIHGTISTSSSYRSFLSRFMEQAFVANSLRGMDSSGVFQVTNKKKAYYHKLALPGPLFVENKMAKLFMSEAGSSPVTVGHVRHATAGKVNVDNSHPFIGYKNDGSVLIGVHNGTLTGWSYRPGAKLFDVDSDWAISRIADEGADAFEDFTGSYAFVWWTEAAPDVVYMARNKERPLHFVLSKDRETMMFCSEPGMLAWLIERNQIPAEDEIYVIEEDKLYAFDIGGKTISWSKSNLPSYKYSSSSGSNYSSSSSVNTSCSYTTSNTSSTGNADNTVGRSRSSDTGTAGTGNVSTSNDDDKPSIDRLSTSAQHMIRLFRATLESVAVDGVPGADDEDDDESPPSNVVPLNAPKHLSRRERKQWRRQMRQLRQDREQLDRVANGEGCEDFGSDLDIIPDEYFKSDAATSQEKQVAKSTGIYGKLMYFMGVLYDNETAECWGEIEDFIPGGTGKVRYDAIIPNTTASVASRKYINNNEGTYVAVIGRRAPSNKDGGVLIVAEVSKEGVEKFAKALS